MTTKGRFTIPERFYSLDVLRGIASLSIVLWHWQHFFLPFNPRGAALNPVDLPFYRWLSIFYKFGDEAVQLFFCLSGFIFFWLYAKTIAEKMISLKTFAVLRLSRLYPLHLATLLLVAGGQLIYSRTTHSPFVYPTNDAYHFVLNLLLASSWGFEKGYSFNAPIWSVSVEILLYAIFFMFCRLFRRNIIAVIMTIIIGHLYVTHTSLSSGVECFFLGGLAFIAYEKLVKGGDVRNASIALPLFVLSAWAGTLAAGISGRSVISEGLPLFFRIIFSNWTNFILFPVTIMALALIETKIGTLGKRFSFIGEISYSSYLLHFPLQLAIAIAVSKLAITQTLFYSPWFLISFYVVLVTISLASHRYFELPVQRMLRVHEK